MAGQQLSLLATWTGQATDASCHMETAKSEGQDLLRMGTLTALHQSGR